MTDEFNAINNLHRLRDVKDAADAHRLISNVKAEYCSALENSADIKADGPIKAAPGMKHFNFQTRWRKLKPHLYDPRYRTVLDEEMNAFCREEYGKEFPAGALPGDIPEHPTTWRFERWPYREPQYAQLVHLGACHRLALPNLILAMLALPGRPWMVVSGDDHSTVWDGAELIFDPNFFSLGISANEALAMAGLGNGADLYVTTDMKTRCWLD